MIFLDLTVKNDKALIVFARLPVEGKAKTRLAKDIGDKNAASFYRVCAEHLFSEVRETKKPGVDLFLFYSNRVEADRIKEWVGDDFSFYAQIGDDLGIRMLNAFDSVFKIGYEKIIIVGTDVPEMNSGLLEEAFSELDKNDFVIGQSTDGGYYLLGMKFLTEDIFKGINWGTATVFNSTINMLDRKKVRYSILKKLIDIDTKQDLVQWLTETNKLPDHSVRMFVESISEFL